MPQAMKQDDATRRSLVNLRISMRDRNVIDRAAKAAGLTRTQFMVDAARRVAHESLLDETLFVVDKPAFAAFEKLFGAPAKPNTRLRALMARKAP